MAMSIADMITKAIIVTAPAKLTVPNMAANADAERADAPIADKGILSYEYSSKNEYLPAKNILTDFSGRMFLGYRI